MASIISRQQSSINVEREATCIILDPVQTTRVVATIGVLSASILFGRLLSSVASR